MIRSHRNTKKVTYKFDWEVVRVHFPDPPAASPFHSPPFSPTPVHKYLTASFEDIETVCYILVTYSWCSNVTRVKNIDNITLKLIYIFMELNLYQQSRDLFMVSQSHQSQVR